jgi:hypothetical protein
MGIIGRVKGYELGNVVIIVPGDGEKTYFITTESRDAAQEHFPVGSPVRIILGNTKTTKGTVMGMEHLAPDENRVLIEQELEANKTVVKYPPEEWRKHLPGATSEPAFTHAVLPKKDAPTDYGAFNITHEKIREMAEKKCGMVPDVNVSCRDALIAQQSCLNRAVEIFEFEQPVQIDENTDPLETINNVNKIIKIKDLLFLDVWKKAGMPFKEKKE